MQVRGRKVLHFDILLLASLRRIVSAASWAKECLAKAQGFIIRATHLTMAVELLRRVNPSGCLLYPGGAGIFIYLVDIIAKAAGHRIQLRSPNEQGRNTIDN